MRKKIWFYIFSNLQSYDIAIFFYKYVHTVRYSLISCKFRIDNSKFKIENYNAFPFMSFSILNK